jgi:hypothetical protein
MLRFVLQLPDCRILVRRRGMRLHCGLSGIDKDADDYTKIKAVFDDSFLC